MNSDDVALAIDASDADADLHVDPDAAAEGFMPALEAARPWRIAGSLLRLRDQVNSRSPNRNKKSDGAIGDVDHQKRNSDHNPWVTDGTKGVVTAMDITHDAANGCDAGGLADALRASADTRIKYIIWNRRICNSSPTGDAVAWAWRPYTGKSPHDKHVHVSVRSEKASYDSNADWSIG